ncbi:hypothetical protein P152DRAFT_516532 [Eremomyces bilateralis CBS 781.70]|uniref:Uncharacterized protein n=1 Tax=Eremomyces bilateralis CBS 781.70 TaxID=1392243 RepID=A0A6G1FV74_9PEZI|nr:uncharacterized protein P152DRAFT_516532 [Eremomyces bilateralis CBS 781.70]KAF1809582.1 hypothetical protein P152DRAFT_516532 [Eremomyces bilateralis CBS 781.70]
MDPYQTIPQQRTALAVLHAVGSALLLLDCVLIIFSKSLKSTEVKVIFSLRIFFCIVTATLGVAGIAQDFEVAEKLRSASVLAFQLFQSSRDIVHEPEVNEWRRSIPEVHEPDVSERRRPIRDLVNRLKGFGWRWWAVILLAMAAVVAWTFSLLRNQPLRLTSHVSSFAVLALFSWFRACILQMAHHVYWPFLASPIAGIVVSALWVGISVSRGRMNRLGIVEQIDFWFQIASSTQFTVLTVLSTIVVATNMLRFIQKDSNSSTESLVGERQNYNQPKSRKLPMPESHAGTVLMTPQPATIRPRP